jgi:hypothetical protein
LIELSSFLLRDTLTNIWKKALHIVEKTDIKVTNISLGLDAYIIGSKSDLKFQINLQEINYYHEIPQITREIYEEFDRIGRKKDRLFILAAGNEKKTLILHAML